MKDQHVGSDRTSGSTAGTHKKLRKKAQRYQKGSLNLQKLKSQPSIWVYRYYTEENGKRVYMKVRIGSVVDLPKRKDAEKAVMQLRVDVNEGAAFAPMNLEQLAAHYKSNELPEKAYSTQEGLQRCHRFPHRAPMGQAGAIHNQRHCR